MRSEPGTTVISNGRLFDGTGTPATPEDRKSVV